MTRKQKAALYGIYLLLLIIVIAASTVILNGTLLIYPFLFLLLGVTALFTFITATKIHVFLTLVRRKIAYYRGHHVPKDPIYPILSCEQEKKLQSAVKVCFTGDLILLREAVERAYNLETRQHDFTHMFEHVTDIWKKADLAIGVFEGPMGGEEKGWSTSNYGDGIPLALNFPDEFGKAVKAAGMGLVSLSNNHLLDVGMDSALRTMDVLNHIGLDYVGAYHNEEEYNHIKIINLHGKRVAVLAYTYGLNNHTEDVFFEGEKRFITRPLVAPSSKYFKQNKELVKADFAKAREAKADAIFVLPHMGKQFRHYPDKTQKSWCDIFVELGADLILSDHTHAVQPLEWRQGPSGKRVLIVHCPGNFINSYTLHDGDASMIVNAYLDPDTLEPIASSIIPIYSYCKQTGSWTGLPVYKAIRNKEIYASLSRADFRRLEEVHQLVCKVALDAPLTIDNLQEDYLHFPDSGYVRRKAIPIEIEYIKQPHRGVKKTKAKSCSCFTLRHPYALSATA